MIGLCLLIRDHGDVVEADLAFQGIDLRDLYRPGSGLTPRRLLVLIRGLPAAAALWAALDRAEKKAQKPTVERIRERQEFYAAKGAS
jgi:hypothetical protein